MTVHKELLSQISAASESLNAAAEAASDTLSSVEKRLLESEPGVTVWHGALVEEETTFADEEGANEQNALRRVTLGFAKVKGKWGIAVREELLGKKKARDTEYSEPLSSEISLLRKSDRDLRILALPQLTGLLEAILEALTERAERLAPPAPEPTEAEAEDDEDEDEGTEEALEARAV